MKGVTDDQLAAFLETAKNINHDILSVADAKEIFIDKKMNDFANSNGWNDFRFGDNHLNDYTSATKEAKASFLVEKFAEAVKNQRVRMYLTQWLEIARLDELYQIPPS